MNGLAYADQLVDCPNPEVSMERIKVAVVQVCSTEDVEANLARSGALVRQAAADGATWIAGPENVGFLKVGDVRDPGEPLDSSRIVGFFRELAAELGVAILVGSFHEATEEPSQRAYNTSVLLGADGSILATYRKIHLFDIDLAGSPVAFRESDDIKPGDKPVVAKLGDTSIGLSVCYDLRFAELYRQLVGLGASVLTVPAAFTNTTGMDHWEVLLRARAIENQCYVVAPNQWGRHGGKRHSYGHSMIVDPWGHVVARVSNGEGWASAWLEPEKLASVRRNLPCAQHRRIR
jgi:deaminated glutathione amidase